MFVKLYTGILVDANKFEDIVPVYIDTAVSDVLTKLYSTNELEIMGFNIDEYAYYLLTSIEAPIGDIYHDEHGNRYSQKRVNRYLSTFKLDSSVENYHRILQDDYWFYPKEKYGNPVYYVASIRDNAYFIRLDEYRELENKLMATQLIDLPSTASLS